MPYGIPPKAGGNSASNTAKLEKCVVDLMAKGHSKSSAIAICKSGMGFTNTPPKPTHAPNRKAP